MRCQRAAVESGGLHPDEHLAGADLGPGDLRKPQDVGRAVAVLNDGAHRVSELVSLTGPAATDDGGWSISHDDFPFVARRVAPAVLSTITVSY